MKSKLLLITLLYSFSFIYAQQSIDFELKNKKINEFLEQNIKIKFYPKINQYKNKHEIHLFIDENGNHLKTGFPTKLTKENTFILHIITSNIIDSSYIFNVQFNGNYISKLEIEGAELAIKENYKPNNYNNITFAGYGPFTKNVTITVSKKKKNSKKKVEEIYKKTLTISKTYHVSIATGFFISNLSNPLNIKAGVTNNNKPTLIADEINGRGIVSINAVYYPYGRNYLFSNKKLYKNIGVLVGTQINKKQFENLFGGLQYDFSRGGSIAFGAHYGKVNILSGLNNFTFGEDFFEGDINTITKKEWKTGFFIGLNLDIRIFKKLFNI